MKRQIVFFDMGKVILPFSHIKPCEELGKLSGRSAEDVYVEIFSSGLEDEFETGKIDADKFTDEVIGRLALNIPQDELQLLWSDIFHEDKAVTEIIARLKPTTQLVLLSNTNEWHFNWTYSRFDVLTTFDDYILSYKIGTMKPSPKIFARAIKMAKDFDRVLYTDDKVEYVNQAQTMGLPSILFKDAQSLESELVERGFL